MLHINRNSFHYAILLFLVVALVCSSPGVQAQTDQSAGLEEFVLKAHNRFQLKNQQTLFSLHRQNLPYFAKFKQEMLSNFAQRQNVRIVGKRLVPIKADVQADTATVRLVVNFDARDIETGRKAEGFPDWDHTLYLVKEQGTWKLWRFVETAEEFSVDYLAAKTDTESANLIAKAHPVTPGLLKGLEE